MSENKKQQLVPRLRFPEFCDDQSWSFQSLGRLARRSTKKNTEGDITRVLTNSAEYGVIDQRDFFDKDICRAPAGALQISMRRFDVAVVYGIQVQ